jgi:hypothetical protein
MKTPESEEPVFAEVTSYHHSNQKSFRTTAQDNRLMLYYQGIKVYVPEDFNSETLLTLLKTLKQL